MSEPSTHSREVISVCVTPDGLHVVTGSYDTTARVWLLADGSLVRTLQGHSDSVLSVCVTTLSLTILSNAGQPHLYRVGARA